MDALYQNALLYAIGWAILHSFWQMALAWMTFQLLFGFRKQAGPELRYIGAVAMLGTGGVLFLLTTLYEYRSAMAMGTLVRELTHGSDTGPSATGWAAFMDSASLMAEKFMPYLSSAYLIILFFLAARLWSAWLQTRDIRRHGLTLLDEPWTDEIRGIADRLGLGEIGIYLSDRVQVPVTLGHMRPLILLPVATLNYLTIDQAKAVLLHEIAHIRRKDYLVNIGVSVIGTMLFFNPFVHVLSTSLRRDREMCCDDFVLQCRQDAGNYARALMSLEQFRSGLSPAMVMAATGQKGQLLNRVKRILDINNGRAGYGQRLVAFLFLAGLLSTLAWMAPDAVTGMATQPASAGVTIAKQENPRNLQLSINGSPKELATFLPGVRISKDVEVRGSAIENRSLALVERQHPDIPSLVTPAPPVPPDVQAFNPIDMRLQSFFTQEGFKPFDEQAFIGAFRPLANDLMTEMEETEQPRLIYMPAPGQIQPAQIQLDDMKVELEKTFKQLKGVRVTQKEMERQRIAYELEKRAYEVQKRTRNSHSVQDWQKKMAELAELDNMLRSDIRIPDDVFEITTAPDAVNMAHEPNEKRKFRFTWSSDDRKPKKATHDGAAPFVVTPDTDQLVSIAGIPAPPAGVSVISEPSEQHPRPVRRATTVSSGTQGPKGVRIIVVEQEPRNIEIRLERD